MKEFLRRLKLIDYLTTTLPISKPNFVNRLQEITDIGRIGMFSDTFDVFSSSKNEFKGHVDLNGFKLKRRRRFFDTNMNFAIASGTFTEANGQLTVETEVNGFKSFFILFYVFLIIFYSIFIFGFWGSSNKESFIAIPFILLHGTFMFALPYFMMRRSVKRLKYELEREFFYLTKTE
ncbi:MAG: uncharacterized protein JWR72_4197 [Flavisolibacter sp.]|nr:uncharacterized protein [Flavisolibacter sp.]